MRDPQGFQLETAAGATLRGYIDLPMSPQGAPIVVMAHGFKGFMEWGFFPHLAQELAGAGFAAVRFNFSGAGMQPGDEVVTDLAAFRNATVSQDLDELLFVLASAANDRLDLGGADRTRISLFGHSRGGGVALLAAAHPEWRDRLRSLVTWAALGRFDRLPPEQIAAWQRTGQFEILNVRTGQRLQVGLAALEDFETNRETQDLLAAAGRRRAPWLIVHGDRDETIPHREAEELHRAAAAPCELLIVPGGDHGLGGRHPFPGPRPELEEALAVTLDWYGKHAT